MARARACGRGRSGGFSLIELLVVVMIIGILAALAIPTMSTSRYDQQTYADAGSIMQLFRTARTRAVARGGAQLIAMSGSPTGPSTTDRGTFMLWESVSPDPTGNGSNRLPISSCTSPTVWAPLAVGNQGIVLIDGVNLNTAQAGQTTLETAADIEAGLQYYSDPTSPAAAAFTTGFICYTPLGRSFVNIGTAAPAFGGLLPTVGVLEVRVTRGTGGNVRSVLVPPNGMARLFSHT